MAKALSIIKNKCLLIKNGPLCRKLSTAEDQVKDRQSTIDIGIQVCNRLDPVQTDLLSCLADLTATVTRLNKRNKEQRKEIAMLKSAPGNTNGNRGARSRESNNSHHSRESPTSSSQEQADNKFPPLQSQSYWHRRVPR